MRDRPESIVLIAAMAENRVIGRDGGLPWHLPADLRHFRQTTTGHTVIMGRRTWDECGRPLPDRRNIVVTRNPGFRAQGAEIAHSLDDALEMAAKDGRVFVIGGATLYELALPIADRIELTLVHAEIEGDTRFPPLSEGDWRVESERRLEADERNEFAMTIRTLIRAHR